MSSALNSGDQASSEVRVGRLLETAEELSLGPQLFQSAAVEHVSSPLSLRMATWESYRNDSIRCKSVEINKMSVVGGIGRMERETRATPDSKMPGVRVSHRRRAKHRETQGIVRNQDTEPALSSTRTQL